ncbi:MAG: Asp-tRNA(Asn)/Glu-tRNA(Gln) amidotransferase subunit GatB [Ignavibacteriae bacterium]|nr:Asp-tRNA(Asn)/Glu-tRNA(Gln) amidotransferase subunit GatB [Ignavibacteria bacterium]MBI3363645.1 Asp-tRNA(Asn)/Glu-tRNA(Gln) amidotransferase subunit GatB [Ignavibacteriota bacterium]
MKESHSQYEAVIGLEVHAQLLTDSKAFCGCTTKFGSDPNTNVCPICLGLPGVLPVLNKNVVEFAIRMGLATYCRIAPRSVFARKNYFYPDLPKGYQISQYEEPICTAGYVKIDLDDPAPGEFFKKVTKRVGITRIHMEEDAGKSIHDIDQETLVDINRCGIPLIEIVSEPDLRSPHEAYLYLRKIRQIAVYLGICDGNMEEGSLRCDANVSVRMKGETSFGTKTEVKNLNSFRFVEKALEYEINRQIGVLEERGAIDQETLLWDADRGITYPMRSKETAHDYRYFPEPDLVPVFVDQSWIEDVRKNLTEHPTTRRDRFISDFGLPWYDANVLTEEKGIADFFEREVNQISKGGDQAKQKGKIKLVANWVMASVLNELGKRKITIDSFSLPSGRLASMIELLVDGTISSRISKQLWDEMMESNEDPKSIVERKGLTQISDEGTIEKIVVDVLSRNQSQVEKYRAGEEKVLGFFVGQVMKATGGKANPGVVNAMLKKKLSEVR